jgi:hypothetical protein
MLMLNTYLDETGHSKDELQKFVGMAGLIAPEAYWTYLEGEWKGILRFFNIPYFHMKEFAHSEGVFKGWKGDEPRRRDLYGVLLKTITLAEARPIGSIVPMDIFRKLTKEQQGFFTDPYYLCFQGCITYLEEYLKVVSREETIALIMSEQMEFKNFAQELFDFIRREFEFAQRIDSPVFRDMRRIVPLQAADIVAFELYMEYERRLYAPTKRPNPRYAYPILVEAARQHAPAGGDPFIFHTEATIARFVRMCEQTNERLDSEEKKAG